MMNTVKEIIYTVGDSTGTFAKHIGLTSADLAKSISSGTVKIARDVGPRRALIGAAILAAAVGGSILLVRYLRRREEERLDEESMGASDDAMRNSRLSRAERRAINTANANMR